MTDHQIKYGLENASSRIVDVVFVAETECEGARMTALHMPAQQRSLLRFRKRVHKSCVANWITLAITHVSSQKYPKREIFIVVNLFVVSLCRYNVIPL